MKNYKNDVQSLGIGPNISSSSISSASGYVYATDSGTYTTNWIDTHDMYTDKNYMDDSEIKEKVSKKIDEILDEDSTIDLMKKYLSRFIEENIDNPENLIKQVLVEKDKELEDCRKEIEDLKEETRRLKNCKKEIEDLEEEIRRLKTRIDVLEPSYPPSINPIIPTVPYPDITWNNGKITCTYSVNIN